MLSTSELNIDSSSSQRLHKMTQLYMFDLSQTDIILCEDICVSLYDGNTEVMHVWFNTNFIDETGRLLFKKDEMDFQKNQEIYSDAFTLELELKEIVPEIDDILREADNLVYDPLFNDF